MGKGYAVIARVRLGDPRVFSGLLPIEAAVDDHAADRRAVTADELRRGVNDDVSAPLERSQIRRREGRVDGAVCRDDERLSRSPLYRRYSSSGCRESEVEDRLSVVLNRSLERALNITGPRKTVCYPGRKREGVAPRRSASAAVRVSSTRLYTRSPLRARAVIV